MPKNYIVTSYILTITNLAPNIVISYFLNGDKLENTLVKSYKMSLFTQKNIIVISYIFLKLELIYIKFIVNSYIHPNLNLVYYQMESEDAGGRGFTRPRGPPPAPPASLGSILYPKGAEPLNNVDPIEHQLAVISRDRQMNERNSFKDMKGAEYREFRQRHQGFRYCETCSEACTSTRNYMRPVFHRHGSSKQYRALAPIDDWGAYLCLSCEASPHRVKISIRTPLLISGSSLHNWQGRRYENQYPGDKIHMDTLTIPGGTINTLQHGLQAEYGKTYRPLDVLAVFGINDLLQGKSVTQIVKEMEEFQAAVHALAPEGEKNSVAIATLFLPPKLSDFEEEFSGNRREDIIELNFHILRLNNEQHQDLLPTKYSPKFHSWGLKSRKSRRSTGPRPLMGNLPGHRHNQWREETVTDMLHLNDATRLRMGRSCVRYFLALYGLIDLNPPAEPARFPKSQGQKLQNQRKFNRFRSVTGSRAGPGRRYNHRNGQGPRSDYFKKQTSKDRFFSERQGPRAAPTSNRPTSKGNHSSDPGPNPKISNMAGRVSCNKPTNLADQRKICQQMVNLLDKLKK